MEVDGQLWATAPHGAVDASGSARPADGFRAKRDLLTVYTLCGNEPPGLPASARGLEPGMHVATLRPVLEQSGTELPAVEIPFSLSCRHSCGCADGGFEPDPGPDAGPGIGADPDDGLPQKAKGCSQAGGGLSVLGALAALRLWRRRTA
jgi:hypothetical protein